MGDPVREAARALLKACAMPQYGSPTFTRPAHTWVASFRGGECEKYGRYYGHCHCCELDSRQASNDANADARSRRESAISDAAAKLSQALAEEVCK